MFDLFDDRANITKRQLIYASTCFPDEISSFSENKAKEVAAEKFFGTPVNGSTTIFATLCESYIRVATFRKSNQL
tara:strand:+ start:201 stop:425 length:225 start_codon:yes stop_codon:yes gene_type:complete